jgi:prevent-host-death family protein
MWTVASAKQRLSEILRLAKQGQPQFIGAKAECVVISAELYREKISRDGDHDGRWLLERAGSVGFDIPLPDRTEDRPDIDWTNQ